MTQMAPNFRLTMNAAGINLGTRFMKSIRALASTLSTPRRWLVIVGLAIAGPLAAAWDHVVPDPEPATATFQPEYLSTPDANGYWATGTVDLRGVVARFDNDGSLRWLRYVDEQRMIEPVGGGDAFSADDHDLYYSDGCTLRRWRTDGGLVWRSRVDDVHPCQAMTPDGTGGAWMTLRTEDHSVALRRVAADGVVRARIDLSSSVIPEGAHVAIDIARRLIYIVGSRPRPDTQNTRTDAAIIAVDEGGVLRWQWLAPVAADGGNSSFRDVVVGADGFVYAAGTQTEASLMMPIAVGFTHDGMRRFQTKIWDAMTLENVLAADEGVYVVVGSGGGSVVRPLAMEVLHIDDAGIIVQRREFASLTPMRQTPRVTAWRSRDGKRLAIAGTSNFGQQTQLVQLTATSERMTTLAESQPVLGVQLLDNAAAVAVAGNTLYYPDLLTTLLRFDSNGLQQDAPETLVGRPSRRLFGSALAADGTSYMITRYGQGWSDVAIERLDPDGARAWRVTRNQDGLSLPVPISVTGNRLCYWATSYLECLNASNGQHVFTREFSHVIHGTDLTRLRVLPSGAVLTWYWQTSSAGDGHGMHFAHIRSDGSLLFDRHLPDFPVRIDIGATGIGAILTSGIPEPNPRRIVVFGADGGVQFERPDDFNGYATHQGLLVGADGSVVMLGLRGSRYLANYYSPGGALRWSIDFEGLSSDIRDARIDGDALIYLAGTDYTGQNIPAYLVKSLLGKRSLLDGSLIWQREVRFPLTGTYPSLAIDSASGNVALTSAWPAQRIRVQSFDAASGAPRLDRSESCAAEDCTVFATVFGSDGRFRVLAETDAALSGVRTPIFVLDNPPHTPEALRVDQPGISGTWFPDYASGQGFVVDYLPATRTVFAPWFVYTPGGGNQLAAQRWFTLQGSASEGATDVELGIYRNSGGAFAAAPITTAQRVGTARLSLSLCARAALDYVFDAPPDMAGAAGRIALTRATAGVGSCAPQQQETIATQAESQTSPFDARLSGSWHVPAQSGQGLMLSVTPGSLLFATWFTYDPAGAADDATAQHWFTLQAGLDGVIGNTLTLPIYRTIGGSFDRDPTANTSRVGEAILSVQNCDRATLAYRFDTSELAAGFAGLNGSLALQKIGGCSP